MSSQGRAGPVARPRQRTGTAGRAATGRRCAAGRPASGQQADPPWLRSAGHRQQPRSEDRIGAGVAGCSRCAMVDPRPTTSNERHTPTVGAVPATTSWPLRRRSAARPAGPATTTVVSGGSHQRRGSGRSRSGCGQQWRVGPRTGAGLHTPRPRWLRARPTAASSSGHDQARAQGHRDSSRCGPPGQARPPAPGRQPRRRPACRGDDGHAAGIDRVASSTATAATLAASSSPSTGRMRAGRPPGGPGSAVRLGRQLLAARSMGGRGCGSRSTLGRSARRFREGAQDRPSRYGPTPVAWACRPPPSSSR
jgi:hypothetical protein